jgi:hypothetical protein
LTKTWDMATQLAIGSAGEALFLKFNPDLVRLDGRKGDFVGFSKRKIELKTESRTTKETPNLFIERYRNDILCTPGGPWQALEHKVYYIVYMYADGVVYWFKVAEMVEWLEAHENNYKKHRIPNKGWASIGWLVPRASVEHLIIKKSNLNDSALCRN